MADFQWWLLLVGLVAGGGLVAVMSMDGKRREVDLDELERTAEANWISARLAGTAEWLDGSTVASVLRLHREYLEMPPPDAFLDDGPDGVTHHVRDDRGRGPDEDLAGTGEEQAPAGQEADAGTDGKERGHR
jgi:hypothetical protein